MAHTFSGEEPSKADRACTMDAPRAYESLDEIKAIIRGFKSCALPREKWTHAAHLTVALWYLFHYSGEQASSLIRNGIKRYNASKGVETTPTGGYHETITLFWTWAVGKYLLVDSAGGSLLDIFNAMLERLADKNYPLRYYSRDRLMSWEARISWVEPDLLPLD